MDRAQRESIVLDATMDLLARAPLEEVTMADIARHAGMSKRTLYGMFPSREQLLGASLARVSEWLFRPLASEDRGGTLEERLQLILTINPLPYLAGTTLEILRVVIAKAHTYPDLARRIGEEGQSRVIGLVRAELAEGVSAGELTLGEEELDHAATMLVDMVLGNGIRKLLDTAVAERDMDEHPVRRDRAIRIFLDGTRRRDPA
ncbi:TetR/AcrR family transcriptional regulator [Salipiger mucosus]|uniref:Transcriptional regulator, TetR family n=1 Tax=Salipiger mucosus DSM 16094 TaxID=1123237 RepID=S9QJ94_9RHOB|nr:TetR/AcrR family transcriptional regulator [Salipiger mucosus]EPX79618.1 Transcriptional regulator, TetR family [Salipiger mucosus DSM 16094]